MMALETWRRRMILALEKALHNACNHYNGTKRDQIEALLKCGNAFQAYFILTQTSQKFANETKTLYFLEIKRMIGVLGKTKDCNDMEGMEVTQRTGAWRKCLTLLIPWWTEPDDLDERVSCRNTLTTEYQEGTIKRNSQFSTSPLEIGTYIHEAFGESIAAQCAKMFHWDKLTHIVPGRIVHAGLPWIGVTPDAISVVDEEMFHNVSRKLYAGETISAIERGAGAPWMTLELKTIHGRMREDPEEDATLHEREIDQLYSIYENDQYSDKEATKEAALKLFVKKLEAAGWIPKNLYAEDNDFLLENDEVKFKKMVNSKKRKSCAFFKRSTIFYPTEQFENLRVEDVGGEVYPNLAQLPTEWLRNTDEPVRKRQKSGWHHIVSLKKMVTPGKACMVVYRIGKMAVNEVLFSLVWEEAPFMLTLNSDHFNQTLVQHATARQFNEDVKSLFAVALKSYRRPSTEFGKDPVQLAIVYAYDVGIQAEAVDAFSNVLSREIALASQGFADSKSLHAVLFKGTTLEDRRDSLYRRASLWEKLPDPGDDDVLIVYRDAFSGCSIDDFLRLDEWTADDVE